MSSDQRIRELAAAAPNFGYLLVHDPLLVMYGAMAEQLVFEDPNTSMVKCRQFGEALTALAFAQFGIPGMPDKQHQRLKTLADQGFLNERVRSWFDAVRKIGNKANHEGFAAQKEALLLVRASYELGAWFHRTVSGHHDAPPFVPPQPREKQTPTSAAEAEALGELQKLLDAQRAELAEMRLKLDEHQELRAAEVAAQRQANEEIRQAMQAQAGMAELIKELAKKVDGLQRRLTDKASQAEPISPSQRDDYVERSKTASRPRLNEMQTRRLIDRMLTDAGWAVQDRHETNVHAAQGVAVREVPTGKGRADYLLYVDAKLVGVVEAKREGTSLGGVDQQSARYATNLDAGQRLAAWRTPLPFRYESTGVETRFTNAMDPIVRPRRVFSFHQPSTIARWMREAESDDSAPTYRCRIRRMPELIKDGLRNAQIEAIEGLEESLADDRPRSLIQMATGAGKTYTMVTETYRLLRHAGAHRVLFLVDRNNLGRQAQSEFDNYRTPDDGTPFSELYNVQRLRSDVVLSSTKVVISTVQRLYALLRGEELTDDEEPYDFEPDDAVELDYNAAVPPETFDLVIVDECHRSIYGKWRAVLEYFDAHLVGLTATPVPQTFGFFNENLVSQYTYRQAVADGVNVDYDIMRIRTEVGEHGGSIPANVPIRIVDLHTKKVRYEPLDTNLDYNADAIGRTVMNLSQIRTVIQQFHDHWSQYFEQRTHVPKTLIFAKTDQHADEIVQIVREIFGGDSTFCAKVTYRADNPEQLISDFRNDPAFRIAVTVDMIATGTDIKPLECVLFLRGVSSATYFEQMKGRGARTVDVDEFQRVTPDARAKEKFLLVDPVGVTDSPLVDAKPLQPASQRQVSLEKLLNKAASQGINAEEAAALASRLGRLDRDITHAEREELTDLADGQSLRNLVQGIERATDEDAQERAFQSGGEQAQRELVLAAVRTLAERPELRKRILDIRRNYDMPYDPGIDKPISVEARRMDEDTARHTVDDWRQYMADNADEIAAFRVAFSDPRREPNELYRMLKKLAAKIEAPPHRWTPARLWQAYKNLGIAKGNGSRKDVPHLMAILQFELGLDSELRPPLAKVEENLANWLARQEQAGAVFTVDQRWWLDKIAVTIANRLIVSPEDLNTVPFTKRGGVDGFIRDFGDDHAEDLLADLNRNLPA
ncbi:helicase, type I site-specific restriction-modification system restriction subunit [Saccharomonospora marina XMU15]|uniref:Helicase, type I site-specific restriction-modification system restriction subunit n=1 Tax=Saccharomonospora marina XMU15 TaxID=882083 RepID=H5X2C2_9PSEU|nr:DEAD/DEAH box helicase family protein [Saccharomonospora marina]EHR48718.1 helicase, type I site-specific restriction-modification system restriction subunit [Saccharomonospora marina XMU15]